MKNHPFIDGLRALAVLPVIFFHLNLPFFSGGYIGVDVFFVISGFLITGLLYEMMQQNRFSIVHFYERRARRILPALFVTCLLTIVLALVLYMPEDFRSFSKSLEGVAVFGSNFIFARRVGYFAASAPVDPLLHTWSLAVEEQFYVIFPLLLWLVIHFLKDRSAMLCRIVYVLFGISLALNLFFIAESPERTFYLLQSRAWELLAGSILALRLQKINLAPVAAGMMSLLGLGLLVAGVVLYDRDTVFPGVAALLPVIATLFLIWPSLTQSTIVGRLLSTAPFVSIGLVSYGLYLYHWPVIVFARYYLDRDLVPADSLWALPLVGGMAILSYIFVEKPIRSGTVISAPGRLFRFSGLGLLVLGIVGLAGVSTQGFPSRFDASVLQYASAANDAREGAFHCVVEPKHIDEKNICKLGVTGKAKPDFLVWGDSHAASLYPAINTLAQKHGKAGWMVAYAGCPSLVDVDRADHHIKFSCSEISKNVMELIKRNRIKKVLLVDRWDMYALGWEKGGAETVRNPAIAFGQLTGKAAFAAAFKETVRRLKDMGVTVWVVKQVPPQLVNIPSALAKAQYLGRNPEKLKRSYDAVLNRRRFIDETFAGSGVSFIDPVQKLCSKEKGCMVAWQGHSLYSDNDHLSVYGALWGKDMFAPFFTHN